MSAAVDWRPDSSAVSFLAKRGEDEFQKLYLISTTGGEAQPDCRGGDRDRRLCLESGWKPDRGDRCRSAQSEEIEELEEQGFDQDVFEEDRQPLRVLDRRHRRRREPPIL